MSEVFSLKSFIRPKEGLTISRKAKLGQENAVTYFSLGEGTDISPEAYDCDSLYLAAGGEGTGDLEISGQMTHLSMKEGDILLVPEGRLFGKSAGGADGFVYVEVLVKGEAKMNKLLKAGEVFKLKDLVDYEESGIANLDLVSGKGLKFMVLALDQGTELEAHRAPGDAIVFALEGKAVIGYEGKDYPIQAGENFRFEKNALHSVKADGRFKMALLLVLE